MNRSQEFAQLERPWIWRAFKGEAMISKAKSAGNSAPISRTSAGLRDAIFDEIDAIRNGASNPTRANAVAKLATGIVETVRMEIEVQRHLKTVPPLPKGANLGSPMSLGVRD